MTRLTPLLLASILTACGGPQEFSTDEGDGDRSTSLHGTNEAKGAITTGFPFVARIVFDQLPHTCTGALITPRHVLTAGHCRPGSTYPQRAWVYFGAGSSPRYRTTSSHVRHPGYIHGAYNMYDLMILTLDTAVPGVTPVKVLPRKNTRHLEAGSYVRHVSWGPSEAGGFGAAKSTIIARTNGVANNPPGVYTVGDADHGDSGSPVLQRRRGAGSGYQDMLVAVVSDEAIRSTWINESAYTWIRGVVGTALSDNYDGDAINNIDDDCPVRSGEGTDADKDGVGSSCDACTSKHDPGQFNPASCDLCPFPVSAAPRFDRVQLYGSRWGYWTKNRARIELVNARSDQGLWSPTELRTAATLGGGTMNLPTSTPWLTTLAEGRHTASVILRDGCGNDSAPRTLSFGVDDTPPDASMSKPTISSFGLMRTVTVEALVGDKLSGIGKVEVWLGNAPDDDEFTTERKLCSMPGPWLIGDFMNKASCSFTTNWLGTKKILVVAWDRAGNMTTAHKWITVSIGVGGGGKTK